MDTVLYQDCTHTHTHIHTHMHIYIYIYIIASVIITYIAVSVPISYIYMYKPDLILNKLQWLICQKNKSNKSDVTKLNKFFIAGK